MPFFDAFFHRLARLFCAAGLFQRLSVWREAAASSAPGTIVQPASPRHQTEGSGQTEGKGGGAHTADGGEMATMNGARTVILRSALQADHVNIVVGRGVVRRMLIRCPSLKMFLFVYRLVNAMEWFSCKVLEYVTASELTQNARFTRYLMHFKLIVQFTGSIPGLRF